MIIDKCDGFVSFEKNELEKAIQSNDVYWLKSSYNEHYVE